jgi:hypothetical protein
VLGVLARVRHAACPRRTFAPTGSVLAPTSDSPIAPTNVSSLAPTRVGTVAPTIVSELAPTRPVRKDRLYSHRVRPYSIDLTMSSTTFFASPNTIIVLSM